jgi:Na+/H+ antiporter NhaD/arsenite permease-like protein
MVLDNVTTVVLIAPVTILICEILGINAQPYLLSEALLSNTGGVGTMVGDPPNILIASAAGFSFNDFLIYSLPIVFVTWFVALGTLRFLFRKDLNKAVDIANVEALQELRPRDAIKDMNTIIKVLVMIVIAFIGFLSEEIIHLEPSTIALTCSAVALFWVRPEQLRNTLNHVEWDILIFFGALADVIVQGMVLPPVLLGVIMIWVVAIMSAIVDNVPITIALIPVISSLGGMGVEIAPLWWALAFGAGFGGNGTIIGSTANVVVTSLSERTRNPITPSLWNKRGLPVMLTTCTVASGLYVGFYYLFGF